MMKPRETNTIRAKPAGIPSLSYPGFSFHKGTFSLFIGPSHLLSEALNNYLVRQCGCILSLSGNDPEILSRVRTNTGTWNKQTVTEAHQLLTTLEKSTEPLILIEHDRSLYDEDADYIMPIAMMCREKVAKRATVFIFGARLEESVIQFEPYVHKMVYIEELEQQEPKTKAAMRTKSGQCTLPGVI